MKADKFKVPAGIQLSHDSQEDEMMKMQASNVITNLLAGKAPTPAGGGYNQPSQGNNQQMSPEQMQQMKEMMRMMGGE